MIISRICFTDCVNNYFVFQICEMWALFIQWDALSTSTSTAEKKQLIKVNDIPLLHLSLGGNKNANKSVNFWSVRFTA